MDRVALPVYGGKLVLPTAAMGYSTSDGRRILAWDFSTASFHFHDQTTRTHGHVMLHDVLRPPACMLAHPPVGKYAVSATHGHCRVDEIAPHAILVRSSTAYAAVLPESLRPLGSSDNCLIKDVRLILDGGAAFVFSNVFSSGGVMGTVAALLRRIKAKVDGDLLIDECVQPRGLRVPLRTLASTRSICIALRGRVTVSTDAICNVVRTTADSALWHAKAFDWLETNPWVLPCTLHDLWEKLPHTGVPRPDAKQVPQPWAIESGMITSNFKAPAALTRAPATVSAACFVCGVRSGSILLTAEGTYVISYADGSWGAIEPGVDLAAIATDLEKLARSCCEPGLYAVRSALPSCPDALFREMFGSGYDNASGTFHRLAFS